MLGEIVMNKIKLFIEGFIIGLGKIIPGVSGSVLAICFGVYEHIIESMSSFKLFVKNKTFILTIGTGILFAILIGSGIIKFFLVNYYLKTLVFFIGMMIPGILPIIKNISNKDITLKRIMACSFLFIILFLVNVLNFQSGDVVSESEVHKFISLILCGFLDAGSTIIPGISGSAILMLLGYYEIIITSLSNLITFTDLLYSLKILFPFLIGMVLGVVLISKFITYAFKYHRSLTYMLICTFTIFSVIALLQNVWAFELYLNEIFVLFIYLIFGAIVAHILESYFES